MSRNDVSDRLLAHPYVLTALFVTLTVLQQGLGGNAGAGGSLGP